MTPGEAVRFIRKFRGDTRKDLAQRAGISPDYLKKIETGKRLLTNIDTLKKLADALQVNVELLLYESEELIMSELSRRDFLKAGISAGVTVLTTPAAEVGLTNVLSPQSRSPEAWIVQGDSADVRGDWNTALEYYRKAIQLLPKDYRWARCLVEKVAQMYINEGAFDLAEDVFFEVENAVEEWGTDTVNHNLIVGLIAEKRGWIRNFQGKHDIALDHFRQALSIAKRWGDIRLESTSHHFLGRAAIEGQSLVFYPEIVHLDKPSPRALALALSEVRQAKDFDRKSDPNVGFDLQWESLGLLLLGQYDDAKKALHKSIDLLRGFADTEPLIDLARLQTWEAWERHDYDEVAETLLVLLEDVSHGHHPYAFVRACLSFLCARYLAEHYRSNITERRRCVDLCIICLMLHFEPDHMYFTISNELLNRFTGVMDDKEFAQYLRELPGRVVDYTDDFGKLKNFPPPTLALLRAVSDVIYAIGFRPGRIFGGSSRMSE